MQLVPLFDDTKAYLNKVETVDKSSALQLYAAEAAAAKEVVAPDAGATSSMSELMQLVPLFDDTKAYLNKVETVDKSSALYLHSSEVSGLALQPLGAPPPQLEAKYVAGAKEDVPTAGAMTELPPQKLEICPPEPHGQIKEYFTEWGVPSIPAGRATTAGVQRGGEMRYSAAEVDRSIMMRRLGGAQEVPPPLTAEVCPPAPRGQTKAYFEQWGVPTRSGNANGAQPAAAAAAAIAAADGTPRQRAVRKQQAKLGLAGRLEVPYVPSEVAPPRRMAEVKPPSGLLEKSMAALSL